MGKGSSDVGDRSGQARALVGLGRIYVFHREFAKAAAALDQRLAIYRELGDRSGKAEVRKNLRYLPARTRWSHRASGSGADAGLEPRRRL